jgi:hypothetical protein
MWKQVESWEIWLTMGVLFFGGLYIYNHVDFEDLLTKNPPAPLHMEGKIADSRPLKEVQIVSIPNEVYETMAQEPKGAKYLMGNKKYIIAILPTNCPYANAYKNALNYLFKEKGFSEYYRKHLMHGGFFTCRSENCSMFWLYNHCGGGICLINPARREAVIDNSQNTKQLPMLLEKYKNW